MEITSSTAIALNIFVFPFFLKTILKYLSINLAISSLVFRTIR